MLDRALAALCARYRAVCRVDDLPWGMVLQWRYDYNLIVVQGDQPTLEADELEAAADGLQWFLPEKGIELHDAGLAARVGPELVARGWEEDVYVVLARPTADVTAPDGVGEIGIDAYAGLRDRWIRSLPWGGSDSAVEHVLETDAALAAALPVRIFGVVHDGAPVAAVRYYDWPDQGVGEVDDVYAVPEHRGKGHGGAAVLAAVAAAGAAGRDACWLLADLGAPAVTFYERLGFTEIGRLHDYRQRGAGEDDPRWQQFLGDALAGREGGEPEAPATEGPGDGAPPGGTSG